MKASRQAIAIIALVVIWGATALWGLSELQARRQYDVVLQNKYSRAFYETMQRTKNVEALLSKGLVSGSSNQMDVLFSDLWYNANSAQDNLSQLPVSHEVVARTAKFLTQVGDYAYSLARTNKAGSLNDKDWQTMQQLYQTSVSLNREMSGVQHSAAIGTWHWTEIRSGLNQLLGRGQASDADDSFRNMETQLHELPVLVYDGPFSDHIDQMEPQGLSGGLVTLEQAKDIAGRFTDLGGATVQQTTLSSEIRGKIPSYSLQLRTGVGAADIITVDVSKQGGHVVFILNPRRPAAATLSDEQARAKAEEWLTSRGLTGFVPTYTLKEQNILTISFAYRQGDVIIYPDLIKVQVALDNGQILGYEAMGYLTSHRQRALPAAAISMDRARGRLSSRVQVLSQRLALIPTSAKGELLAYEFKTKLGKETFLVYINAENGEEEQILKLLDLPNGTLTL
jgi:spore germination protein